MTRRTGVLIGSLGLVLALGAVAFLWVDSRGASAGSPLGVGSVAGMDASQAPIPLDRVEPIPMTVYLSPTCGCCAGWVEHMAAHGFEATLRYTEDLAPVKEGLGVSPALSSCHTAIVNGYVVEGHVPGDVVRRMLAEGPAIAGIAAPGMPVGSPGMEMGDLRDPYDVIAFTSDGRTRVYSSHGR